MATSLLALDMTLTGRLEKMRGEGEAETLGLFERGSLELAESPLRFLDLDFFPCSCSFSACLARTGERRGREREREREWGEEREREWGGREGGRERLIDRLSLHY